MVWSLMSGLLGSNNPEGRANLPGSSERACGDQAQCHAQIFVMDVGSRKVARASTNPEF
jgi:hypothetical protein